MYKRIATLGVMLALAFPASATVTGNPPPAAYSCNGTTTTYTIPFPYLATSNVTASVTTGGIAVPLALTTDFTVSPSIAPSVGTLTLTAGSKCPNGSTLTISRNVPLTQPQSFRQGAYNGPATEQALDRAGMQIQQLSLKEQTDLGVVNNTVAAFNSSGAAIGSTTSVLATGSTTPMTLAARFAQRHTVTEYGAKCDWNGSTGTDDSAAIQTAITSNYGGTLDFPPNSSCRTLSTINISSTAGIVLRGNGATIAAQGLEKAIEFTGDSSNVTIHGLKFSTTLVSASGVFGLIMGLNHNFTNIAIRDCDFTSATGATNGIKFDNSTVGTALVGLEVTGNRFVNVGRMGVEIVNHTFDDVSRYEQVRITNNRFDGLGVSSAFGQAVSLSGMGKGNVVANNTISNVKDIGIELVGPWTTVVANNTLRNMVSGAIGISQGKPVSASAKPIGLVFADNTIEGNAGYGMQLTGMNDAAIKGNLVTGTGKVSVETSDFVTLAGNTFDVTNQVQFLTDTHVTSSGNLYANRSNTVGFNPNVQSTTLSRFTGDEFLSERQTGLLVDGTSANNIFVGCTFSNENSPSGGNALQFNGASVTGNLVVAPVFRRTAAGGTTWAQATSAAGNFIEGGVANTLNPDSVSAPAPLTLTTGSNAWSTPLRVNGTFVYVDSANTLRLKTTAPTVDKDGTPTSQPPTSVFANLGTPANGSFFYCSDCTIANPCAGAGTGAFAKRLNGVWVCN